MELMALEPRLKESQHPSHRELLTIFPEAKPLIGKNLKNYIDIRIILLRKLQGELKVETKRWGATWFAKEVIKNTSLTYQAIEELNRRISQLRVFQAIDKKPSHVTFAELIERAKIVPIESIAMPHLKKVRKYGDKIVTLCPFHSEKSPSFYLYIKKNYYKCYGCDAHGDIIEFVRKIYGYSMREAVNFLINY